MRYDTWSPYDPNEHNTPEDVLRRQKRLKRDQHTVRAMLPGLRQEIEKSYRDRNKVSEALAPYYEAGRDVPLTPADMPEVEAMGRLILKMGGLGQNNIQEVLLRLVGATATPESVPFLLEMFRYTRRGDHFGPERRQLALWGLARIAIFHQIPDAYDALRKGLDDRHADVRFTTIDLIIEAYIKADHPVPQEVVKKIQEMIRSDADDDVRHRAYAVLQEPWTKLYSPKSALFHDDSNPSR